MSNPILSSLAETVVLFVVGREILWNWHHKSPLVIHRWTLVLLSAALLALVATPWLEPSLVPVWPQVVTADSLLNENTPAPLVSHSIFGLLRQVYIAGVVLLTAHWGISLLKLLLLYLRSSVDSTSPWRKHLDGFGGGNIRLIISSRVTSPMTWGALWPTIAIPASACNWSHQAIHWTLLHELSHIRQRDWLSQQLARLSCVLFWPIPLTWELYRTLCEKAELTADNAVLASGASPSEFAAWLLSQTQIGSRSAGVALAPCSPLEQRMKNILCFKAPDHNHSQPPAQWIAVSLALALPLALIQFDKFEVIRPSNPGILLKRQTIESPTPPPGSALISRLEAPLTGAPIPMPPAPPKISREPPPLMAEPPPNPKP